MLVSSCVYPYDIKTEGSGEEILVFDGQIRVGDQATLRSNCMLSLSGDAPKTYNPLKLSWYVEDEAGVIYRPGADGNIDLSIARRDRAYRFHAEYGEDIYESDWQKPLPQPEIDNISFSANDLAVTVSTSLREGPEPTGYIALSFDETWEFHTEFVADYVIDPETWEISEVEDPGDLNYWCWRSARSASDVVIDLSHMDGGARNYPFFSFSRRDSRNHRKYSMLLHARTLSEQEYRYRYQLQQNAEGGSDLFTPDPGSMPGNIACINDPSKKVFGYISVSQVTSLRAWLGSEYLMETPWNTENLELVPEDKYYGYYYNMNYRPVTDVTKENVTGIGWGPARCVDCVEAGGTLKAPDFWPGVGPEENNPTL